jgi:hypothetical protein
LALRLREFFAAMLNGGLVKAQWLCGVELAKVL